MTTGTGQSGERIAGSQDHWREIRADGDIQFAPIEMPQPDPPPEWLVSIGRFLARLFEPVAQLFGGSWFVVKWVLLGLAVAGVLLLAWRILAPLMGLEAKRTGGVEEEADWVPDRTDAAALLEEADRLAAEGRYDEATHLLLRRSVEHIASARPDWLEPSSTAREIGRIPALSDRAKQAFGAISTRVERSLFALRPLVEEDWVAARGAYADFALTDFRSSAVAA